MDALVIAARNLVDRCNYALNKTRHRLVSKASESALRNLDIINAIEGAKTSAAFERANLLQTRTFKTREALFKHCLDQVTVTGLFLEFGTYKGNSINIMAKHLPQQHFYGFDSFEGLPEGWTPGCRAGAFSLGGKLPAVRKNVSLIKGFFDKSLPPFVAEHQNEKVAFLHVDCDLYSSTKTILDLLRPMLTKGTVICFDEYYNYPEWLDGEYKAFTEFTEQHGIKFEYLGYIRIGSQLAVKIV